MDYFQPLEEYLSDDYPVDLINLIIKYLCDCNRMECDFCKEVFTSCYLKRCACCKRKTCGFGRCPNFDVDFLLTYAQLHKIIKCCHKCVICKEID